FLPMLFMGEEFSASNPFLYFVSHTDPELIEAVRKGRNAEFSHINEGIEAPDPQAVATFEASKLPWQDLAEPSHKAMFHYYQSLIALRKEQPALKYPNRKQLEVKENEEQQTLLLH